MFLPFTCSGLALAFQWLFCVLTASSLCRMGPHRTRRSSSDQSPSRPAATTPTTSPQLPPCHHLLLPRTCLGHISFRPSLRVATAPGGWGPPQLCLCSFLQHIHLGGLKCPSQFHSPIHPEIGKSFIQSFIGKYFIVSRLGCPSMGYKFILFLYEFIPHNEFLYI